MWELYNTVQDMRENGEHDLRTVLHHIEKTTIKIKEISDKPDWMD